MTKRIVELLAPAGSLEAFFAALAAGADAVYTGLGAFNARAAARDIELADFRRACAVAHGRGARVYVTENVYLREGELPAALELARCAQAAGADALIVADAGLARAVRAALPDMEVHLSTQAGAMSAAAVRLAARELGAVRVTCARELSVDELADLCATDVPIEAFCHGAICICYSGACAFSAIRRGRSANRGDCTQPCRLAYDLVDDEGRARAAVAGDRLLCPRDYLSIRHLRDLVRAGVSALKIEGRMKNPDYVFNVVRTYRAALDALAAGGDALDDARLDELAFQLGTSFNRGFTDAYLRGTSGCELMSFERAINQGVRVGTVVDRGAHEVTVALEHPVRAGDTLEIRTILPPDAPSDVPVRYPLVPCEVDGCAGASIRVRCKRRVGVGSPVHLTASARVLAEASDAVERMRAEALELAPAPVDHMPCPSDLSGQRCTTVPDTSAGTSGPRAQAMPPRSVMLVDDVARARVALRDDPEGEVAVFAWRLAEDAAWEELVGSLTVVLDEPCRRADEDRVRTLCSRARAVVCRNLGQVDIAREAGAPFDVAAPVSATNAATVRWLLGLGARRVWLPDELAVSEVLAIAAAVPTGRVGVLVHGAPQLMVCEHCLLTAEGPCDADHAACSRRRETRYLVEASGAKLPVRVDALGRARIFGEAPRDLADDLPALREAGVCVLTA
ncbi:U32 family peptidase [Collinsella tanakaei]|uniref:U32 family peptidase n=1 Tax=Collinsella tanakaei TaxID=626935 RepID=UPI001F15A302|nr:U32 family peptidase [Collinsella tanakaei]MCF2621293.1 U32 family peptidase [Collinsella tanakaei]